MRSAASRLVVLAHFNASGSIAPYVKRHIEAWNGLATRLIVVSTSPVNDSDRDWLSSQAELIERENEGYDFKSYQTGLLHVDDLNDYDEIVICNDSFVGPLIPYQQIFDHMANQEADFWGITVSKEIAPHVQSYFVTFRSRVIQSEVFSTFWHSIETISDRGEVIRKYEIGLSQTLLESGFSMGEFFTPSIYERLLARSRWIWFSFFTFQKFWQQRKQIIRKARGPWNISLALADRVVPFGKFPIAKIEVFRLDPMGLGGARLMRQLEQKFPDHFSQISEFVTETDSAYTQRNVKKKRKHRILNRTHPLVRYRVR